MKRFLSLFSIVLLAAVTVFAQNDDNGDNGIQTLFGGEEIKSTGYGGPHVKFTTFDDEFAVMVGGRGGWTINKMFTIGLSGTGLVTPPLKEYRDRNNEYPKMNNIELR